ncbi:reverse transcriptase [Senna tora]|uniref:Reverse transcriptase n=1 Tax=Senna tora TaxID=362788 RepID=A0A835CFF8_9FABA|nr:reverse transcriptase [Senna tora]
MGLVAGLARDKEIVDQKLDNLGGYNVPSLSEEHLSRKEVTISQLMYADDTVLFFEATPHGCQTVQRTLSRYADLSRQKMNFQKFILVFSPNTLYKQKMEISKLLGLRFAGKLGKYLGTLVEERNSKQKIVDDVVSKIKVKLQILGDHPNYNFVSDLIQHSLLRWDKRALEGLYDHDVIKQINAIPILATQQKDRIVWKQAKNGEYSVKEGYKYLIRNGQNQNWGNNQDKEKEEQERKYSQEKDGSHYCKKEGRIILEAVYGLYDRDNLNQALLMVIRRGLQMVEDQLLNMGSSVVVPNQRWARLVDLEYHNDKNLQGVEATDVEGTRLAVKIRNPGASLNGQLTSLRILAPFIFVSKTDSVVPLLQAYNYRCSWYVFGKYKDCLSTVKP